MQMALNGEFLDCGRTQLHLEKMGAMGECEHFSPFLQAAAFVSIKSSLRSLRILQICRIMSQSDQQFAVLSRLMCFPQIHIQSAGALFCKWVTRCCGSQMLIRTTIPHHRFSFLFPPHDSFTAVSSTEQQPVNSWLLAGTNEDRKCSLPQPGFSTRCMWLWESCRTASALPPGVEIRSSYKRMWCRIKGS